MYSCYSLRFRNGPVFGAPRPTAAFRTTAAAPATPAAAPGPTSAVVREPAAAHVEPADVVRPLGPRPRGDRQPALSRRLRQARAPVQGQARVRPDA